MEKIERKIVGWLRAKIKEAGAKGLLCGISGGVDSAVVAALIKKAAGSNHLCLIMPCHSIQADIEDAKLLAEALGLKTGTVNLCGVFDMLLKIYPPANKLAAANLKARLRMLTLYYYANKFNYLVIGTGNKSELMMGYFTKYGDGGVDLLPLGNLLKCQVRQLAEGLGVPRRIIDKPPSAGLWQGQTDEAEMGITYEQLDTILADLGKTRIPNIPARLVKKVKDKIKFSKHKRLLADICKF